MLGHAMRRREAPKLVQATALRLPFRDASFDAIVSTGAFHWFPDQAAAQKEFRRVVTPKGRILLKLVSPSAEWLCSAVASHVKKALPAARHVELDCGHVPQIERPTETHAAIAEFLREGAGGKGSP
jgi:ubiquinone/menaquinone biosynthesis C-methylase UbiE